MAIANPSKNDYIQWVKENEITKTDSILSKAAIPLLGPTVIEESTTTKNFIFFTIFTTKIDRNTIYTIGIVKNFIIITLANQNLIFGIYLVIVIAIVIFSGYILLGKKMHKANLERLHMLQAFLIYIYFRINLHISLG